MDNDSVNKLLKDLISELEADIKSRVHELTSGVLGVSSFNDGCMCDDRESLYMSMLLIATLKRIMLGLDLDDYEYMLKYKLTIKKLIKDMKINGSESAIIKLTDANNKIKELRLAVRDVKRICYYFHIPDYINNLIGVTTSKTE